LRCARNDRDGRHAKRKNPWNKMSFGQTKPLLLLNRVAGYVLSNPSIHIEMRELCPALPSDCCRHATELLRKV
jgi:hypothetical protein